MSKLKNRHPGKGTADKKKGGSKVNALCKEKRESLSTVLSYLFAFGNGDATGLIKDVMETVALRKEVKRGLQDLAGEETYMQYIESL